MAADRVGETLGNYTLLRVLGQGTFAEVYLGEHRYLERPAAIKVLHVRMQQPAAHDAFRAEAKLIARLQHPHLVQVFDFGIEGETPYLVMDYAPNGTLRSRHPRGTPLSFEQIVSYVQQIASALDYAHTQHIIHRDIKPDNLLLNAKDEIVISDFGIAVVERTLDSLSTQDRAGTPLYMAPEQIGQHPCAASDQYAVGVMVYEWLCGASPFPGPGLAIFGQHLYQEPPSLCKRVPDLPQEVEDAVFGALAKDPQQRFASVGDFAQVLEEAFFATQPLRTIHPQVLLTSVPVVSPIARPPLQEMEIPLVQPPVEARAIPANSLPPLPSSFGQGCLWGLVPGVIGAALVLSLRQEVSFYLATFIGYAFYVLAGFLTTRRGGPLWRGAWAGYWSGISSTVMFWIMLGIGLLFQASQYMQAIRVHGQTPIASDEFRHALAAVSPQFPGSLFLPSQPPWVNLLVLLGGGLLLAVTLGVYGGKLGRDRYKTIVARKLGRKV